MADFKALLAARKAAAEKKEVTDVVVKTVVDQVVHDKGIVELAPKEAPTTIADPIKEEPVVKPVEKPLTFQEKMALKKAEAAKAGTTTAPVNSAAPTVGDSASKQDKESPKAVAPVSGPAVSVVSEASKPATIPAKEDTGTLKAETTPTVSLTDSDIVVAQAYADIKGKIEHLESLEDTALEGAMKELKKSLMANPNAVSLMLDTDIGKMVIALRRITKEAQVEAEKEKKPGAKKAAKMAPLSAEMLNQVFDEL